ncbi:MAG: class I SAM-dependent rRNA methyltransferase [Elusimicrobia bacterium]|nr:class I SAM-dependent rRNA methyltransferase [Candidatus Liberimonas magnetica]
MKNLVIIKKDRLEKILLNKHPWVFSGAVAKASPEIKPGAIVPVCGNEENIVAYAAFNPKSSITLRIISWDSNEKIDRVWFTNKIKGLSKIKETLLGLQNIPEEKKNYRLVFSDADSLPGLVIDRYGLVFVVQLQTYFADLNRELWVEIIKELYNPAAVYERSDVEVRRKEGLSSMPTGALSGKLPKEHIIEEDKFQIPIDIENGQKTGYFLDLRQARKKVEHYCSILNVKRLQNYFGYSGSFNLYAARAGVKMIEHIDISEKANETAKKTAALNGFGGNLKIICQDSFKHLEGIQNESTEAIILDPPSFVKSAEKIDNAVQGYERLNELAMKKLAKNGVLFTYCCSSYISEELFQKTLFKASVKAKAKIKLIEKLGHDQDHAWPLNFPEARYFQGWILLKEN